MVFDCQQPLSLVADDIGLQAHYIGAGVIDVSHLPKSGATFEVFCGAVDGAAIIKMPEVLQAWHDCVKRMPRTSNSRPSDPRTRQIVRLAAAFSHQYSVEKLSKGDPFRKFVREFYELVTGTKPYTGFSSHIEAVLKEFPLRKRTKAIGR